MVKCQSFLNFVHHFFQQLVRLHLLLFVKNVANGYHLIKRHRGAQLVELLCHAGGAADERAGRHLLDDGALLIVQRNVLKIHEAEMGRALRLRVVGSHLFF